MDEDLFSKHTSDMQSSTKSPDTERTVQIVSSVLVTHFVNNSNNNNNSLVLMTGDYNYHYSCSTWMWLMETHGNQISWIFP